MTFSSSGAERTLSISSATSTIRSSFAPRVVIAAVPRRIPEVWNAERVSNGTIFLFTVISAATRAFSATLPVSSGNLVRKSSNIEWLSVPPETMPYPRFTSSSASTAAFFFTCVAYSFQLGSRISPNATALAAITCSNGPPWFPGNTAESRSCDIFFTTPFGVFFPHGLSKSSPIIITPPRGPRSVLCVVVVTM